MSFQHKTKSFHNGFKCEIEIMEILRQKEMDFFAFLEGNLSGRYFLGILLEGNFFCLALFGVLVFREGQRNVSTPENGDDDTLLV